jgi:hypothetical protein
MFRFRELMHRIWMRPWVWQQHSHRWSWDDWCFLILFVLLLRDIPAACRQTYSSCWNAYIQKQWLYSCWYKQLGNWRQWIAGYELLIIENDTDFSSPFCLPFVFFLKIRAQEYHYPLSVTKVRLTSLRTSVIGRQLIKSGTLIRCLTCLFEPGKCCFGLDKY